MHAADCHTFIRLLSVDAEISDIAIRGVTGGCRVFAVNMDAAVLPHTAFQDSERPQGVSPTSHGVTIEDLRVHKTTDSGRARFRRIRRAVAYRNCQERAAEPTNNTRDIFRGPNCAKRPLKSTVKDALPGRQHVWNEDVYGEIRIDTAPAGN